MSVSRILENNILSLFQSISNLLQERTDYTDLYFQISEDKKNIKVYDDDNLLIEEKTLDADTSELSIDNLCHIIRSAIAQLIQDNFFEKEINIQKPFSIHLVDSSMCIMDDLLFLDEEFALISDPLLQGIDKDLDLFLEKILEN